MSKQFIRGSQIYFHNLRMLLQSLKRVTLASLFLGSAVMAFSLFKNANPYIFTPNLMIKYGFSKLYGVIGVKREINFKDVFGQLINTSSDQYIYWYEGKIIPEITHQLNLAFGVGLNVFILTFCLIIGVLYFKGRKQNKDQYLRGVRIIAANRLKKMITWHNISHFKPFGYYKINNIPYPKDTEYQHTIITGASGTGKTQVMLDLVDQIRKKGGKAVIYDKMGTYVRKFYDADKDIILSPFDQRSRNWSFFAEGDGKNVFDNMTRSLIEESKNDPFWANAARAIVSEASLILAQEGNLSTKTLCDTLLKSSNKEFAGFLKDTNASAIADDTSDRTIASIRSVLSTYVKSLELLDDADDYFSIKNWISDDNKKDSILFLTSRIDSHETAKPLLTLWLDLAISQLLSLDQEKERTIWFIIDEMPGLQKLPILTTGLAESRQFGGAFVISAQLISQIREVYGRDGSQTISGLCRNRLTFSTPDQDTAYWCSENIGKKEILSAKENISFGASEMRDGINIAHNKEQANVVIPSEIMSLKDLEFYLKFSNGFPITKTKIQYQQRLDIAEKFVEKEKIRNEEHEDQYDEPVYDQIEEEEPELEEIIEEMEEDNEDNNTKENNNKKPPINDFI